jgi:hypothetical protein
MASYHKLASIHVRNGLHTVVVAVADMGHAGGSAGGRGVWLAVAVTVVVTVRVVGRGEE